MAEYKSYGELKGKVLKEKDTIIFRGLKEKYIVVSAFLMYDNSKVGDNDQIFRKLKIKDKAKFCKEAYGYSPIGRVAGKYFPECKPSDYEALTRVTLALFKRSESGLDWTTLFERI